MEFIPALYGKQIEQLILRNCPLCASASPELLRGYFTAAMPRLISFNEVEISAPERQQAEAMYGPLIRVLKTASPEAAMQQHQRLNSNSNAATSSSTAAAAGMTGSASTAKLAKSTPSLLKAHQQQSTKAAASHSGALFGLSAALKDTEPALAQQRTAAAHAPLLVQGGSSSSSSSVGSRTGELLRAAAGQAPAAVLAPEGQQGVPLSLSQRSLFRRSAHTQFAAAFDEAFKRIVFETIAEIKHC